MYDILHRIDASLQLPTSHMESKRVNSVSEDREKNGSGMKHGSRKQLTVSKDTGISGKGCYSL